MAHLPLTGWSDVATKKDLERLQEVLTLRVDSIAGQFESMANQLRTEMLRGNIRVLLSVLIAMLGQPFVQAAASHIR